MSEAIARVQEYSFDLVDLPKSYTDPQWKEIRDLCDLTLKELTFLQMEATYIGKFSTLPVSSTAVLHTHSYISQSAERERTKYSGVICGSADSALYNLKRKAFALTDLPADFFDESWMRIQRDNFISNVDMVAFRYKLASESKYCHNIQN